MNRKGIAPYMVYVPLILNACSFVVAYLLYPGLPKKYPVHFGFTGEPDRWADKSLIGWMALPAISLSLVLLMMGISWFTRRKSSVINIPEKELFNKLDDDAKETVFKELDKVGFTSNILLIPLFVVLQLSTYYTAIGVFERLPWFVIALLIVVVIAIISLTLAQMNVIKKLIRMLSAAK